MVRKKIAALAVAACAAGAAPACAATFTATYEGSVIFEAYFEDTGNGLLDVGEITGWDRIGYDFEVIYPTITGFGGSLLASTSLIGDAGTCAVSICAVSPAGAPYTLSAPVASDWETSIEGLAPVPLPAGAVLMLTAVGGFGLMRRKAKRA